MNLVDLAFRKYFIRPQVHCTAPCILKIIAMLIKLVCLKAWPRFQGKLP